MKPYSNDWRDRVVSAMESGMSCRDAAAQFDIAPSTAGNWRRLYRRTQNFAPLAIGGDRRWKLEEEVGWIADRLAAIPDLTLAEVRRDLEARGVAMIPTKRNRRIQLPVDPAFIPFETWSSAS